MKPSLEEMQRYQEVFVRPMVDAVRQEMLTHVAPLADGQKQLAEHLAVVNKRIDRVERQQTKALLGWSAYATVLAAAMAAAWGWVRAKLHWG